MTTGYRTDSNGNVLGYFDLETVPENTDNVIWVVSDTLPPIPSTPPTILQQIITLQSSITDRMKIEALSGSENTFSSGVYAGKTAAQVIALIQSQIDVLREQL